MRTFTVGFLTAVAVAALQLAILSTAIAEEAPRPAAPPPAVEAHHGGEVSGLRTKSCDGSRALKTPTRKACKSPSEVAKSRKAARAKSAATRAAFKAWQAKQGKRVAK